ncbi:MAG: cupin domain-containing protein [Corynebacterium casei]|uniref:cupin domain-containing protein n=1 Tax=Corynebacterium casei TaxID=160386 RepID=UPI0026487E75|nr:cupin domain-containing protein [Corynebacterium casei]MDN5903388.1 cupin domain-containing protein [Corynebacterium casei]MDN6627571.1 cupin domain-containing protein [Corynebacterium casei]MDN6674687.1 cupin domain-containing protein [Corynebacterium casei]MDN6694427.1 cupin domain-containing protein [Corynebacterium casei]
MSDLEPDLESATIITPGLNDLIEANPIKADAYYAKRVFVGSKGRVTHIAFDADIELKEHATPSPIMVQVPSGCIDFLVRGTPHRLGAGGILYLPADVPHAVHSVEPSHVIVTFLPLEI